MFQVSTEKQMHLPQSAMAKHETAISVMADIADKDADADAGAAFVLESKGNWQHAGFHLTTSIVAPALLSLPWAFAFLGWSVGVVFLTVSAVITFYGYNLLSRVLERLAAQGKRHLRFRDLANDVLGPKWAKFTVVPAQFVGCFGVVIGNTLLGGQSFQLIYGIYKPSVKMNLYESTMIFGGIMMIMSQMPSFHSLRHINAISLLLTLCYSGLTVVGCIYAGNQGASYSIEGSQTSKILGAFNAMAVIAATYGNGIIPEIQATLAPPVTGKMFKGLCICYSVVIFTFFTVSSSGYWAFGNSAEGNILSNFVPSGQPPLVPRWLLFASNFCVFLQVFAVALIYCQPTFEVIEGRSADAKVGKFSARNVIPRLILRTLFVAVATLIAAVLPFFGDVNSVIGALGFMPLDFILPSLLYNLTFRPSKRSLVFWINSTLIAVFSVLTFLAGFCAIRQIYLDAETHTLFATVQHTTQLFSWDRLCKTFVIQKIIAFS